MTNLERYDKLFLKAFPVTKEELPGLKYRGIKQWDSFAHMDLMNEMEEKFKISIPVIYSIFKIIGNCIAECSNSRVIVRFTPFSEYIRESVNICL